MKFEYRIVAYKQREYIWIWEIAKFLIIEIAQRSICYLFLVNDLNIFMLHRSQQCCGSMTFWYGSGSCSFRQGPSKCQKNNIFISFFAFYFLKVHLHNSSKIKVIKMSYQYFCMMMEGSGSVQIMMDPDPGQKTSGSGSGTTALVLATEVCLPTATL